MASLRLPLIALLIGLVAGGVSVFYFSKRTAPHPRPQAHHALTLEKIHALGRLEVLQYVVRDVATYRWTYSVPLAESRLLLIVYGEAVICIDFSRIRILSKDEASRSIRVELPPPEVCQVRIDPQQCQVYDASFSLIEWWRNGEAERVREALAQAQDSLRKSVELHFPRDLACAQAQTLLSRLLQEAGWRHTSFSCEKIPSPTP